MFYIAFINFYRATAFIHEYNWLLLSVCLSSTCLSSCIDYWICLHVTLFSSLTVLRCMCVLDLFADVSVVLYYMCIHVVILLDDEISLVRSRPSGCSVLWHCSLGHQTRDVREWLLTFPFPPIPIYSIPILSRPIPNFLTHSHSHGIPSVLFPFPPIPIPIHAAVQLYITTVHYCTGVTSSSIQHRNPAYLLSLY